MVRIILRESKKEARIKKHHRQHYNPKISSFLPEKTNRYTPCDFVQNNTAQYSARIS